MKANELMIGDWVRITDDDTDAFFDARVGTLTRVENIFVVPPGEEMAQPFSIDCVEPIPITPEILEKNGFDINGIPEDMQPVEERDWSDDTYVWSGQETPDEVMEVCVYMEDPNNFFAEIICQYCHVDGVHIKYVHELQHALRLCGIEKEIVL